MKNIFQKVSYIIWAKRIEFYLDRGFSKFICKDIRIRLLKRMGFQRLPKLFLCPSHECNANCSHCYERFLHKRKKISLTTRQCKNIIDQFENLGGYLVHLCSGEVLLREDILELIEYCRNKGMMASLTTNGILLNEKKVDELKKAGLSILVVSIDSADPEEHDRLRGVPGCFKKATDGLKLAKKKGIRTQIWTYMTKSHANQLGGVAELGKKLSVDCVFVYFPLLSGNLFNKFEENFTAEERDIIRKKYLFCKPIIFEFASESIASYCRGGGKEHVCVMPSGEVTFCPPVPYSYGNIKKESLSKILSRIEKDYCRLKNCTCKQCPVNYLEYRQKCKARFIYSAEEKYDEKK